MREVEVAARVLCRFLLCFVLSIMEQLTTDEVLQLNKTAELPVYIIDAINGNSLFEKIESLIKQKEQIEIQLQQLSKQNRTLEEEKKKLLSSLQTTIEKLKVVQAQLDKATTELERYQRWREHSGDWTTLCNYCHQSSSNPPCGQPTRVTRQPHFGRYMQEPESHYETIA